MSPFCAMLALLIFVSYVGWMIVLYVMDWLDEALRGW